jgi:hypothetical protein
MQQRNNCQVCGKKFKVKTEWQKFCSPKCRGKAANQKRMEIIRDYKRIIHRVEEGSL